MRHALIDENGTIINVIVLNDASNWQPPKGFQVIMDDRGKAEMGGRFDGKEFYPSPVADPVPVEPTARETIAALESRISQLENATVK